MDRKPRTPLGDFVKLVAIIGGMIVAARMYLALLPHSAALGAILVIGTGAGVAYAVLHVDQRLEELRSERDSAELPPGW